jgi:hypothetical protein
MYTTMRAEFKKSASELRYDSIEEKVILSLKMRGVFLPSPKNYFAWNDYHQLISSQIAIIINDYDPDIEELPSKEELSKFNKNNEQPGGERYKKY